MFNLGSFLTAWLTLLGHNIGWNVISCNFYDYNTIGYGISILIFDTESKCELLMEEMGMANSVTHSLYKSNSY